jgi:ABC-type uncharacterized transport system fused permease/ATPase subunit
MVYAIDCQGRVFATLTDQNETDAIWAISQSFIIILAIAILNSACSWISSIAGLKWRRHLQRKIASLYFQPMIPYRINKLEVDECDNIDNRITTDLKVVTEVVASTFIGPSGILQVIIGTFAIGYFSFKADWISSLIAVGWAVGMCRVLCCCPSVRLVVLFINRVDMGMDIWVIIGSSLLLQCLLNRVTRSIFLLQMREGAFRYLHGRIRTYCESIAFYNGEDKERNDTNRAFNDIYDMNMYVT